MNNIGIIVPHIGSSQIAFYTTKAVNQLVEQQYPHDIVVFFENLVPPIISPKCATMCTNELPSFTGHIITTTIDTTSMAIAHNGNKDNRIIFYVWDLEWLRKNKNIYLYNYNAMVKAHKLIARSSRHAKAIENYCGRKVDSIMSEFNISELIK